MEGSPSKNGLWPSKLWGSLKKKKTILNLASTPDAYLLTSIQMKRHWLTWDLFWTCAMSILHFFSEYNHIVFDIYRHGTRSRQPVKNAAHCPNLSSLTVVLPMHNHFFQHFKICESFPGFPGTLSWWRWKCIWFEVIPSMKSSAESPVESCKSEWNLQNHSMQVRWCWFAVLNNARLHLWT